MWLRACVRGVRVRDSFHYFFSRVYAILFDFSSKERNERFLETNFLFDDESAREWPVFR